MNLIVSFGLIVVGLAVLVYAADVLVKGSASIAKRLGLSPIFIGLTIVSFGTSMPELIVNILASFKGSADIAIGNIVGSNISNILLILGVAALIYPIKVKRGTIIKEIPFALLAVIVLFAITNDALLSGLTSSLISRGDGIVLLALFTIFLYYTFGISKEEKKEEQPEPVKTYNLALSLSLIFGGIVGLALGGNILVDNAIVFARVLGVSEALIGLTIVAVGTSLPELATSVVAAYKKHSDIAIGNVVGSNIFNIFWILGVSAIIAPINYSVKLNIDIIICALATFILIPFMFIGKRNILQRSQGGILVVLYVVYIGFLIYRG